MVKFTVPQDGAWTWEAPVEVTVPGEPDPQTITMTFRTVADSAALLNANAKGELSNADLIRALATGWDVTWEDGSSMPFDGDDAAVLIAQPWVSRPIVAAWTRTVMPAVAGNLPPSAAPGRAPATVPAPNRQTRRNSRKTGTS